MAGLRVTIELKEGNFPAIIDKLIKMERELPRAGNVGMKDLTRVYLRNYLDGAQAAGILSWSGDSFGMIRNQLMSPFFYVSGSVTTYQIYLPVSLISLSQGWKGKQYIYLPLDGQRGFSSIAKWAAEHGLMVGHNRWLKVKIHPFIGKSNVKSSNSIHIVRDEVGNAIAKIWK